MRTNHAWPVRIGGLAMIAVAAGWMSGDDVRGQTRQMSSTATIQAGPAARPVCGTRPLTDVEIAADAARVVALKSRRGSQKAGALITIRTYVHVLHDGPEGRLSERTIRDQIAVLNAAYATRGFRFEMAASVARQSESRITPTTPRGSTTMRSRYKTALKEGSGDDLNIYTNSGAGFLGYAYYPTIVGSAFEVLDGVVLAYGTLPGANQPGISDIPGFIYNLGDTGMHEVGHYLGLAHTFEGKCSTYNDGVDDTPAEKSPDFYCTVGRNSCKDGNALLSLDPIHNFMDYSDDLCLIEFTAGQAERMSLQWALYRQGR